jgi:hypothetical protein
LYVCVTIIRKWEIMETVQSSFITLRVSKAEKARFNLLSAIENKSVSKLVKDLVDNELNKRKFTASDLRKMPKELRSVILKQMTDDAIPVYNKYKDDLFVDETGDGIV